MFGSSSSPATRLIKEEKFNKGSGCTVNYKCAVIKEDKSVTLDGLDNIDSMVIDVEMKYVNCILIMAI